MERRIQLKSLNPFITCKICKGYLIDATTVTECLHTFCKTCIVRHLENDTKCPECKVVIHQSHPLQYIKFDRTMQDIVLKLVPNLQENEARRESAYYRSRGRPYPKEFTSNIVKPETTPSAGKANPSGIGCQGIDEHINICLEPKDTEQLIPLKKNFIRCSSLATIISLKKFLAKMLFKSMEKSVNIDILCNGELLGNDHTLKFVALTRWRSKSEPLKLQYQPKLEISL